MNWLKFMKQEPNLFHREDWYAAKTIATMKALKGVSANPKDEIMEFVWRGDKSKRRRPSIQENKLAWAAILGNHSEEIIRQIEEDHKNKG